MSRRTRTLLRAYGRCSASLIELGFLIGVFLTLLDFVHVLVSQPVIHAQLLFAVLAVLSIAIVAKARLFLVHLILTV